jgi:hypothetical protein
MSCLESEDTLVMAMNWQAKLKTEGAKVCYECINEGTAIVILKYWKTVATWGLFTWQRWGANLSLYQHLVDGNEMGSKAKNRGRNGMLWVYKWSNSYRNSYRKIVILEKLWPHGDYLHNNLCKGLKLKLFLKKFLGVEGTKMADLIFGILGKNWMKHICSKFFVSL